MCFFHEAGRTLRSCCDLSRVQPLKGQCGAARGLEKQETPSPVKCKIAFLLPDLRTGGAERVFITLARELASRGHDVELILASRQGELIQELDQGVGIVSLDAFQGARVSWMGGVRALFRLRSHLRSNPPDVLCSTLTGANLTALMARLRSGRRMRLVIREAVSMENVKSHARRLAMRCLYPLADRVIVLTDFMKEQMVQLGIAKDRISVIGNPVDIENIRSRAMDRADMHLIDTYQPFVLCVGRLVPQKDFATVIRAFARIRDCTSLNLVILGDGPERSRLRSLAAEYDLGDRLYMPGQVTNPYPWMKHASAFVLSSRWEGYPNVLLEALCLGTPIISTEYDPSVRAILSVAEDQYVRIVPVGDPDSLSRAIIEFSGVAPFGTAPRMLGNMERVVDAYERELIAGCCRE